MASATYQRYIKSPAWRRLRCEVVRRCGGVCERCHEWPVVNIHHLTYDHWGDERLYELVALCFDCHDEAHEVLGSARHPTPTTGGPASR